MKKIKIPHNFHEATSTLAVFGLIGLASLVSYAVPKSIKKPNTPDIDYDNMRNHP